MVYYLCVCVCVCVCGDELWPLPSVSGRFTVTTPERNTRCVGVAAGEGARVVDMRLRCVEAALHSRLGGESSWLSGGAASCVQAAGLRSVWRIFRWRRILKATPAVWSPPASPPSLFSATFSLRRLSFLCSYATSAADQPSRAVPCHHFPLIKRVCLCEAAHCGLFASVAQLKHSHHVQQKRVCTNLCINIQMKSQWFCCDTPDMRLFPVYLLEVSPFKWQ